MRPNPSVPQFTSALRPPPPPAAAPSRRLRPPPPPLCSDPAKLRLGPSCVRGPCVLRELRWRLHGSSLSAPSRRVLESGHCGRWCGRPWSSPLGEASWTASPIHRLPLAGHLPFYSPSSFNCQSPIGLSTQSDRVKRLASFLFMDLVGCTDFIDCSCALWRILVHDLGTPTDMPTIHHHLGADGAHASCTLLVLSWSQQQPHNTHCFSSRYLARWLGEHDWCSMLQVPVLAKHMTKVLSFVVGDVLINWLILLCFAVDLSPRQIDAMSGDEDIEDGGRRAAEGCLCAASYFWTSLSFVGLFWTESDAHEPIFPFALCHYLVQWVYLGGPERVRAAVWPINSYFVKLFPRLWSNFGRHLKMWLGHFCRFESFNTMSMNH